MLNLIKCQIANLITIDIPTCSKEIKKERPCIAKYSPQIITPVFEEGDIGCKRNKISFARTWPKHLKHFFNRIHFFLLLFWSKRCEPGFIEFLVPDNSPAPKK